MIIKNLLSKHTSLYTSKSKIKTFKILMKFTLERQHFIINHLDFAQVIYDKMIEYEDHVLLKDFIIETKNKFLKLGVSLE